MKLNMKGFYFVTDSGLSKKGNYADVQAALAAGVDFIQYRHKSGTLQEMIEEGQALRQLCQGHDCKFLINDRVDVCLAVDADGVHLGQEDLSYQTARKLLGPSKIIGLTVHNVEEALAAEELGADYLGISPIYETKTKPDAGPASGVELIRAIKKVCKIPVVAIGGIKLYNAPAVIDAGADSLATISAVITKEDVEAEIRKFQELFHD